MRRHVTTRVTYANVVSTLCLVLVLGGGAFAAATITGKDIKDSSIKGVDVKNSSLKGNDVKNGSLTGADVKDASLSVADLAANALPGARMESNAATVPNSGQTDLDMTTEGFDTGGMYTPGDDFMTIRRTGTYLVIGFISWNGAGGTERQARIVLGNGVVATDSVTVAGNRYTQQVIAQLRLQAGDKLYLGSYQNTGAPVATAVYTGVAPLSLSAQLITP